MAKFMLDKNGLTHYNGKIFTKLDDRYMRKDNNRFPQFLYIGENDPSQGPFPGALVFNGGGGTLAIHNESLVPGKDYSFILESAHFPLGIKSTDGVFINKKDPFDYKNLKNKPTYTVLFEDEVGFSGAYTINYNINNYDFIEIYGYNTGTGTFYTKTTPKLMLSQGVMLSIQLINQTTKGVILVSTHFQVSVASGKTTFTPQWFGQATFLDTGDTITVVDVKNLHITNIIGIKM